MFLNMKKLSVSQGSGKKRSLLDHNCKPLCRQKSLWSGKKIKEILLRSLIMTPEEKNPEYIIYIKAAVSGLAIMQKGRHVNLCIGKKNVYSCKT